MIILFLSAFFVINQFSLNNNIDPLFVEYYDEFSHDLMQSNTSDDVILNRLKNIEIILVKEEYNERDDIKLIFSDSIDSSGVCNIDLNLIFIRESFFKKMNHFQRKMLIYHELGHCILGKNHDDSLVFLEEQGEKKSIMNSYGINKYNATLYQFQLKNFFDDSTYHKLKSSLD